MAHHLAMKRMMHERKNLEKPNDDFYVLFKDEDVLKFDAYVIGPSDSLYTHKFVKLRFEIPSDYPLRPPNCTFIQHSGGRIHPNLYVDGKVCLSILGTWAGEPWAFAMTCESVLITIRSLLDNKPYLHEPHQQDNPDYNNYVQYSSWKSLLLTYLQNETQPEFKSFLQVYIVKNGDAILSELKRQATTNSGATCFASPYGESVIVDYPELERDVLKCVEDCKRAVAAESTTKVEAPKETAEVEANVVQESTK